MARNNLLLTTSLSLIVALSPVAAHAGFFGKLDDNSKQERTFESAAEQEKQGNLATSVSIYKELVAKDSSDIKSRIALARIYRKHGNPAEALKLMREAEALEPADEEVLANLGYSLIAVNDMQEAVNVFDKLTAINHKSIAGYNGKAVAFDRAGNHIAAQEIYQKALALSPKSASIQNNLAMSMIMNGQLDTALSILEPLSETPGAPNTVYYNLALAYGLKGDMKRAHETNLKIMPADKADENQFFYEQYAGMLKKQRDKELSANSKSSFMDAYDNNEPQPVDLKPAAGAIRPLNEDQPKAPVLENKFWGYDATPSYPAGKNR